MPSLTDVRCRRSTPTARRRSCRALGWQGGMSTHGGVCIEWQGEVSATEGCASEPLRGVHPSGYLAPHAQCQLVELGLVARELVLDLRSVVRVSATTSIHLFGIPMHSCVPRTSSFRNPCLNTKAALLRPGGRVGVRVGVGRVCMHTSSAGGKLAHGTLSRSHTSPSAMRASPRLSPARHARGG